VLAPINNKKQCLESTYRLSSFVCFEKTKPCKELNLKDSTSQSQQLGKTSSTIYGQLQEYQDWNKNR